MEIDGCMAYLLCNDNQIVRFDLKNIDATNPNSTKDKLEIKVIHQTTSIPCYYISKRYIHVMADYQYARINKVTQAVSMLDYNHIAKTFTCLIGGDQYANTVYSTSMYLISITSTSLKVIDIISLDHRSSMLTRLLLACRLADINVVVRIEESQDILYMYGSLKRKLHLINMHKNSTDDGHFRALSCMYDSKNRRLVVVCKQSFQSRPYALTY